MRGAAALRAVAAGALVFSLGACGGADTGSGGKRVPASDVRLGGPTPPLAGPDGPIEEFPRARLALPGGGRRIEVETARSPREREQGLMYRTRLPADSGMLFYFERQQRLGFWMKNTYVDLDMIFIDAEKKITAVHPDVPRSGKDTPDNMAATRGGVGKYVLELPAGAAKRYGLSPGQRLEFPD